MTKIPDKPVRPSASVQTRIAGRQEGLGEGYDRITADARDSEKGRRSKRKRRRPRRHRRRRRTVFLHRWLVLALGLTGVTLALMVVSTLIDQLRSPIRPPAPPLDTRPMIELPKALALVSRLVEAGTPAELAPLIREGEIPPDRALQILRDLEEQGGGFEEASYYGPLDSRSAAVTIVILPTVDHRPLLAALTPDADGSWRIDFDALVGHCAPPIEDWVEGRAPEGMVRVLGREGFYYNGYFRDDERWACFALTHPLGESTLYAYCPRKSTQFQALDDILRRKADATDPAGGDALGLDAYHPATFRTTLKLRRPEHQIGRQYEIAEVLSDDWVVGDLTLENIIHSLRQKAE